MATQSREWEPRGDKRQVAAGQSLPGGGLAGFPHIVVDVCFLGQVEPVGFGLEQELPGTGHRYGFAKLVTYLDLNSEVLLSGADEGEGEGVRRLGKVCEPPRYG